jgi:iron(III) transport system substrate-binding protein
VIYASKERVREAILGYDDLTKPEWKGRVCIRDGQYASNLGLFADRVAARGFDQAETWLTGLKANLAGRPSGNDASQVQAIFDGRCDLAIGNATVIAAMLTNNQAPDERKWAETVRVVYPDAADRGGYANISGMALGRFAPNRDNAVKLMQFLASGEAQELYAAQTLEYPVVPGAQPSDVVKMFGVFRSDAVPLSDVVKYRERASELIDKIGFNDGPGQ